MERIVDFFQGVVNIVFRIIRWIFSLPFQLFNFFIIMMGILSTAALLWWIFAVKKPEDTPAKPVTTG